MICRRMNMKLNYYLVNQPQPVKAGILYQLEVNLPCPGCARIDQLAVREIVISWCRNRTDYFIGCNCGWHGPAANTPIEAAKLWDIRIIEVINDPSK